MTTNRDRPLKHFGQISGAPHSVSALWRFYTEYRDHVVQIPQMPSGKSVPKKSQMASGQSQDALSESSVRIVQTPSAQLAATFSMKKRLMEWVEAALQSQSEERKR
jgi:hypothetical protein